MGKVTILDFGMGNLFSIHHALSHVGARPIISKNKQDIIDAEALVLPGVGAFGNAMEVLQKQDMVIPLRDRVQMGVPLLGICLGMQLLFSDSEEFGHNRGLGFVEGSIKKLRPQLAKNVSDRFKTPHIGWNQVFRPKHVSSGNWNQSPLHNIREGEYFYFVHSYFAKPSNRSLVVSETPYGETTFCSAIQFDNVFACQFHPERSSHAGLQVYRNFIEAVRAKKQAA